MARRAWIYLAVASLALVHCLWAFPWLLLWPTRLRRARVAADYARVFSRHVLAAAGVRIELSGQEHFATRPAVILFNHVSNLDFFLNAAICPNHALVFGKRELVWVPLVGWLWWLGGHPLVQRGERGQWQRVLDRVEAALRQDRAAAYIAPEGTRSKDGQLGPFKKGAFVLALRTGAPVVPVVLTGVRELHGPGGIHPGTVRIRVLPPIPTAGWTEAGLDAHVEEVRRVYLEALGPSPAPSA